MLDFLLRKNVVRCVETSDYSDNVPFCMSAIERLCIAIVEAYSTGYIVTILDEFTN